MDQRIFVNSVLLIFIFKILLVHSSILDSINQNSPSLNPPPYALSPTYLQFLAKQERKIYNAMKDYTIELEKRLQLVKSYTSDYEESAIQGTSYLGPSADDDSRDKVVASNPILSYRMLSRYANEFISIGQHISANAEEVSSKIVYEAKGAYDFPSNADAEDAIHALLRLQFIYDLNSFHIAEGKIPGVVENIGLTTRQCYQLAKTAQKNQFYTQALDWFNVTKVKLENDPQQMDYDFDEKSLNSDVFKVVSEHDRNFKENLEEGYEHIYTRRIRSVDSVRPPSLRNSLIKQFSGLRLNDTHPNYFQATFVNHIALCNGGNFQTEEERRKLKCWYDTKRNPYWTIRPLKIELVSNNPRIIQIYDILSEKWMSYFKTKAYPSLERAPSGPNATPRTAAYSWFQDADIPETPLSRRIELITGLNVVGSKASEALQIAAYAFGGHVELHFDSKGPGDLNVDVKGDRVTTFLAYLNDVKQGGYTSFPLLGFSVKPVKGSAVLWYTNLKNGLVDPKTLHGACPLIYGHKWIATKWTHINENVIKRPCGLDPLK